MGAGFSVVIVQLLGVYLVLFSFAFDFYCAMFESHHSLFKCSAYLVNCAALCFFELFSPTFELCSPTFEFQSCIVDEYDSSDVITFSRGAFPTISPRSFAHGCLCSPVHQERVEVTGQSLEPSKLSLLSSLSLSLQRTEYEKYRRQHSIATCVLGFDVSNLV